MKNNIIAVLLAATLAGAGIETEAEKTYTDNDLYVLSHIINAECGDDNCSHEQRIATGSVVLNRVASDEYPDTIEGVVFDPGQYSPTWDGRYSLEPSEDSVAVAKYLLENGSQIPAECVFQAEFEQGTDTWKEFKTIYGITYICY